MTKKELLEYLKEVPNDYEIILTDMYSYHKETKNVGITNIAILGVSIDSENNNVRFVVDQTEVRSLNINRVKEDAEDMFKMTWLMEDLSNEDV